jgi:hypothetical protein
VFAEESEARRYTRSNDHRVLAASSASHQVGQLGTRCPLAWYEDGREQDRRQPRTGGGVMLLGAGADTEHPDQR